MRTPCRYPGCNNTVSPPGYCDRHRRSGWSLYRYVYSRAWPVLSRAYLDAHPRCASCGAPATVVDHRQPLRAGGSHDPANLQPLCAPCHNAKTARETPRDELGRFAGGGRSENLWPSPLAGGAAQRPRSGREINNGGVP